MAKAKKTKEELPKVTKTARARLDGKDIPSITMGEYTITLPEPGPTPENFADAAFKANAGSLRRLMVPNYRVVVIYPSGQEYSYGLDNWIKLMDGSKQQEQNGGGRKQPIRKGSKAAA